MEKDSSLLNSYRLPGSGTLSVISNSVIIKDSDFRVFVSNATETELEEVLTTYTHKNKSASVFLGASKPRAPKEKQPISLVNRETMNANRMHSMRLNQPVLTHNAQVYQAEEHREGKVNLTG